MSIIGDDVSSRHFTKVPVHGLLQSSSRAPAHVDATSSTMAIDADRERAVKDALDAVGYRVRLFREADEPNEVYAARLNANLDHLYKHRTADVAHAVVADAFIDALAE